MLATSKQIRFTVDEYFRMSDAGVFDGKRVELIRGTIFRMHAQAHPHRWTVSRLARAFQKRFHPSKYWVVIHGTLLLGRFGAPDPDLHLFDVPEGTEEELLPKSVLVVEASDKSYRKDSGIKLRTYASAGIMEYWIINLNEKRVEVFQKPENSTGRVGDWKYRTVRYYRAGQKIKPLAYPKISIPVNDLIC